MHTSLAQQEVAANKGSSERSVAFVEYLFQPEAPKFIFDDIYHFSMRHYRRHANNRNMLPVVKMMTATVLDSMSRVPAPVLFVPEAITNGTSYLSLAEQHEARIRSARNGLLTTYRMGEILNKDELDALTEKNKNKAMTRLEGFRRLYPYYSVMSPTGMEAMLKTLVREAGFTNYQMLRDEDFEAFWVAVCLNSLRGGFADDVAYSRNGNFETFALFLAQYGVVPFRPRGDIDVVMPGKKMATPYDYVEMLFAHLLDVVPRGFTSDLSVKMAMRMFMLEEMRTSGLSHPQWGALRPERMNPALRALPDSHNKAFSRLKQDMMRFMRDRNLEGNLGDLFGLDGYDGLSTYYRERVCELAAPARKGGGDSYISESRDKLDMDAKLKKKNLYHILSFSIPYQLDGDFFSAKAGLLPDHDFADLGRAEQIGLKAFMGLSETVKPSQKLEKAIFLLMDRRGGAAAQSYAAASGLIVPAEARGTQRRDAGADFERAVKDANIEKSGVITQALLRYHMDADVTSMERVEADAEIFHHYRDAIAAPGPDRLSSAGKIVYGAEILRRQTQLAVFDTGWESSALLAALRLYARKIQLGIVPRPANLAANALNVADVAGVSSGHAAPYTSSSLSDDLRSLTSYLRKLSEAGTEEYPRQAVRGLLETMVIIGLYYNKNMNHAASPAKDRVLIDWQAVPLSLKEGLESDKDQVIALCAEGKALLLSGALLALSPDDLTGQLEDIDPDYIAAHRKLEAAQEIASSRKARSAAQRRFKGFDAS